MKNDKLRIDDFYHNSISSNRIFYNKIIQQEIFYGKIEGTIYNDTQIMVKLCDEETTNHLYNIPINPVHIMIMCPLGAKFKQDSEGNYLHNMKVHVDSIDDSSYGIWFNEMSLKNLRYFREEIFKYLKSEYLLSGELLLLKALEYGADKESIDYN